MGTLTIRNLDDGVIALLKAQAKGNQRSLEGEVRFILSQHADRVVAVLDFAERVRRLRSRTTSLRSGDSAALLREDRDR